MRAARDNNHKLQSDAMFAELDELRFMLLLHEASIRSSWVGQFEWDYKNNRLGYCSKEYASLFGHRHVNINRAQDSWEKFCAQIHPDDFERYLEHCERRQRQKSVICDYRIMLPNGETRHVQETNIYIDTRADVIRGNFGIVRDVSLQKRVESLLDSNGAVGADPDGFGDLGCFLYDEVHEKFLYVDEPLANIYGVDRDFMLESIRTPDEDFKFVYKHDREMLNQVYFDTEMGDIWEAEYRMVRANGEVRWVREMGKSFLVLNGVEEQSIGVVLDISDRKQDELALMKIRDNLEQEVKLRTRELDKTVDLLKSEVEQKNKIAARLRYLANHDSLTGLPGVRLGMDRLSHALAGADRSRQTCAVLFLDLDHFKTINDDYGHRRGDEVLKIIADRLQSVIREVDTVARIGGDEFLVILSEIPEVEIAERIAAKLIEEVSRGISIGDGDFEPELSIGIALYPGDGRGAEELIQAADKAMYRAKKQGRNRYLFAASASGSE